MAVALPRGLAPLMLVALGSTSGVVGTTGSAPHRPRSMPIIHPLAVEVGVHRAHLGVIVVMTQASGLFLVLPRLLVPAWVQ